MFPNKMESERVSLPVMQKKKREGESGEAFISKREDFSCMHTEEVSTINRQ